MTIAEGFDYTSDFITSFDLPRQVRYLNELDLTFDHIGEYKQFSLYQSNETDTGAVFIYITMDGTTPGVTNKSFKPIAEHKQIVGYVTVYYKTDLVQVHKNSVVRYKLKSEIANPHVFLDTPALRTGVVDYIYHSILENTSLVTNSHTSKAAKLWNRLGDVQYFTIDSKTKKLVLCDEHYDGKIWKVILAPGIDSIQDL